MRLEFAVATSGGGDTAVAVEPARRRLDRFDVGVLLAFAAVSVWVLGLDLWQVIVNGRFWTGTDGLYVVDQMQYVAWIREASHHVLVSNRFVLRSTSADYFQPAIVISGALSALGLAPWLSFLLWKPVAVGACFFAVRAYVRRSLSALWSRRAALVLALFFGSFTIVYGSLSVLGDLFPGFLSWGYVFGLLALAAMTAALVAYDNARSSARTIWMWIPGLLGAFASLLHPWHGELLMIVIVGAELILWRTGEPILRRLRLPAVTVALTGVPLLYYGILGRTDLSWRLAREASKHSFPLWSILLAILPLIVPALWAYRRRPPGFLAVATRAWPLAALLVYVLSATAAGATPLHAFQGVTIPLGVLAVQGVQQADWSRLRRPGLVAALAVAVVTIPATAYELYNAHKVVTPNPKNPTFIARDERRAIDYLAHNPERGGVFTRSFLGAIVPTRTDRQVFVGDCLWSEPGCYVRSQVARDLFGGKLEVAAARKYVRESGARFVLADCSSRADLPRILRGMTIGVRRFGCAAVYELDSPGPATGPLAESRADAAVRAARRQ